MRRKRIREQQKGTEDTVSLAIPTGKSSAKQPGAPQLLHLTAVPLFLLYMKAAIAVGLRKFGDC